MQFITIKKDKMIAFVNILATIIIFSARATRDLVPHFSHLLTHVGDMDLSTQ